MAMNARVVMAMMMVGVAVVAAAGCGGGSDRAAPAINRFEATPSWGETPLATELVWELDTPEGATSCEIDVDGDGHVDETRSPCPQTGSVPATYRRWGKFEPVLTVHADGGDAVARTVVYANQLVFAEGVVFPENLGTVIDARVTADTVVLTFDRPGVQVPAGSIVWGTSAPGYVRRVVQVAVAGSTITMTTQPAALEDAVVDGFFGMRDAPLPLADATCLEDCVPGAAVELIEVPRAARPATFEQRLRFTFPTIEYPRTDPSLRLRALQFDLGIRATVELGIAPPRFHMQVSPTAIVRGTASIERTFGHTWKLGKFGIAAFPVGPFVFIIGFDPEVELSGEVGAQFAYGFETTVGAGADLQWTAASGGTAGVSGNMATVVTVDRGFSLTAGGALAARLPLKFHLMGAAGPYVGPEARIEYTRTVGSETCDDFTAALAAYAGAEIDLWRFRITIAQVEATLLEDRIFHGCRPTLPVSVDAGVDAPAPPAACALPWGGSIPSGASITAYAASSVPCGGQCLSQTRTCNEGVLSGSYASSSCSAEACPLSCARPWGGSVPNGGSVTAYLAASVPCGGQCVGETRSCANGVLSGSHVFGACVVDGCTVSPTFHAYGCAGTSYVPTCTSHCYACTTQATGFFAYNDGGCSGVTCFNRFPGAGTYNGNPLVVMFTRSSGVTAHARFFFADAAGNPVALSGNYRIYATVPSHPAANPTNVDPSCTWSLHTGATYTLYNNATPAAVLGTATINQAAVAGTGPVLLFSGNLTGASYITVTNHWPGHATCGQVLLDHVEARPF